MTPKTEQKYIVDTSFNWADEMDVAGCCILSKSEIDEYKAKLDKYYKNDKDKIRYGCGTNEEVYFTKKEWRNMLETAKPITFEEEAIITKLIPKGCLSNDIFKPIFWELDYDEEYGLND